MPATEALQDRVELPEPPAIEVGNKVHDRLVELVATDRFTVPVKPFSEATVIVEVPDGHLRGQFRHSAHVVSVIVRHDHVVEHRDALLLHHLDDAVGVPSAGVAGVDEH